MHAATASDPRAEHRDAGSFCCLEPGAIHPEAALQTPRLLVIREANRPQLRRQFL